MPLSLAFFATPPIAVPTLKALAQEANIDLSLVGVFPDKKIGRKQILTPCPVKEAAQELHLPIREISTPQDIVKIFDQETFDLAIVIAFGMMFPKKVFGHQDIINIHFSSLPLYRGASPVQSAILQGDETLGLTFQRMVPAMDRGDILWHKAYDIQNKTTGQVWEEFSQHTANEIIPFLQAYQEKTLSPKPQDSTQATYCGKFTKEDGQIDLEKDTPLSIYQKYLAFTPWPGIYTHTPKGRLKLTELSFDHDQLIIHQAQLEGRSPTPLQNLLNGNPELSSLKIFLS